MRGCEPRPNANQGQTPSAWLGFCQSLGQGGGKRKKVVLGPWTARASLTTGLAIRGPSSYTLALVPATKDGVGYVYDENNRDLIPDEVRKKVEELKAKIIAGEIEVPRE